MAENNKTLVYLTIFILLVVAINFGYVLVKVAPKISGRAVDTAAVNVTINQKVSANFSVASISWGRGSVDVGQTNATLNTSGTPTVTRGNWSTAGVSDLQMVNNGNVNISLDIKTNVGAAAFIGGTNPNVTFIVRDAFTYATTSVNCVNGTVGGSGLWGNSVGYYNYTDANTTSPGTRFCEVFPFEDSKDDLNISVFIRVPYDTNSSVTGAAAENRSMLITATVTAV